jgi:AcrR family transcriptional regulator
VARNSWLNPSSTATTVREAGVSVPTVCAAYQNKTGLVRALADSADLPRMLDELEAVPDPERHLTAMAGYDRRLFERSGDLIALVREAGRTQPELADLYHRARRQADVYTTLTAERRWSGERTELWWGEVLAREPLHQ